MVKVLTDAEILAGLEPGTAVGWMREALRDHAEGRLIAAIFTRRRG